MGQGQCFTRDWSRYIHQFLTLLTALDIAQVSVDHAKERYQNMRGASFEAKFLAYDAFHVKIRKNLFIIRHVFLETIL